MPPKTVSFIFINGGGVNSLEDAELFVLSDDNRFRFPSDYLSENAIVVQIPFDKLESLLAGNKIEMRLGRYELSFSDDDFKALRNFLPRKATS